jgi:hypothetical protein
LFGTAGASYQGIVEVLSDINSYNALVAEVQNRTIHNLQFDFNYTWSHALDFNQNATTTESGQRRTGWTRMPMPAPTMATPPGIYPNRFVAYALYTFPGIGKSHGSSMWSTTGAWTPASRCKWAALLGGLLKSANSQRCRGFDGLVRRPAAHSYIPPIGRDTYSIHGTSLDDVRVSKQIPIKEALQPGADAERLQHCKPSEHRWY